MKRIRKYDTKTIASIALFIALAYVVSFFKIEVLHLSFNAKEAVIIMQSFIFGPMSAVLSSLILSLLEMIPSGTGPYGALMNFVSSAVYALCASLIYTNMRKLRGAVIALVTATVLTTAVMMVMNIFITPLYIAGVTTGAVVKMIPKLLLPFNFAKYLFNSAITLVLYKPIMRALKMAHIVNISGENDLKSEQNTTARKRNSIMSMVLALVFLAIAIALFIIVSRIN